MKNLLFTFFMCVSLNLNAQFNLVHDINSGTSSSAPTYIVELNNKFYFKANNGSSGTEIWEYDGINTPTLSLDFFSGSGGSNPDYLAVYNSNIYFGGKSSNLTGFELCYYDGSTNSAVVADINPGAASSSPRQLFVFNGKLLFSADDGTNGRELWEYDGVNPPTMLINIHPTGNSFPAGFKVFDSKLYFRASDGAGRELFVYDGINTPSMVANLGANGIQELEVFNDELYFHRTAGEMYKYDGVNPPSLVFDIGTGIGEMEVLDNKLIFVGDDGVNGTELWEYDGTNPPSMIADINTSGSAGPQYLTNINERLFFTANNGSDGVEPWEYDGTNPPSMIQDLNLGTNHSFPRQFVNNNGKLLISASSSATGQELWEWDAANLPVELTQFTAEIQEEAVLLKWQTASEENNKGFKIQHSKDAKNWRNIGFIQGNENSIEISNYEFLHKNPSANNYYRLKQIDYDNTVEYSKILQINFLIKNNFDIFPNPSNGTFTIQSETFDEPVQFELYNLKGQLFYVTKTKDNTSLIDLNLDIPKGFYLLILKDNSGTIIKSEKITIQ